MQQNHGDLSSDSSIHGKSQAQLHIHLLTPVLLEAADPRLGGIKSLSQKNKADGQSISTFTYTHVYVQGEFKASLGFMRPCLR